MKKVILASALLCTAGLAHGAESPEWNQLSVAYQATDFDGESMTGFALGGSALLSDNVFVVGAYSQVSDDIEIFGDIFSAEYELNYNTYSLGLGYRHAISQSTDLFAAVSYEDVELEEEANNFSSSASDDGYGLTVGFRSMVSNSFEISGSLGYVSIEDDSETTATIGADYYFTENVSVGIAYAAADDVDSALMGLSLSF